MNWLLDLAPLPERTDSIGCLHRMYKSVTEEGSNILWVILIVLLVLLLVFFALIRRRKRLTSKM